ncbi:iron complex outermembrane recepter protein [Noviherbaspirillum humi]|uniref:Iron complex outermembrane recepter protein n=1 Tax=Noviherbaspirillum humi TaxID=1688639 RepID=A0A239K014_9BURK|nr:TonB-dependent receptor [Noviherbaspirillum humi]SNT11209.1 iron complex outermembrane recepter protein [Noviherbaspirillum humi]
MKPFSSRRRPWPLLALACATPAATLSAEPDAKTLPDVRVEAPRVGSAGRIAPMPATVETLDAAGITDTINAATTEDALKYLPSILVRKRYAGDTQAPMATRTTGINAGARSLIYVDGILLSALVNNNNQNGSPQWFMVTPEQIDHIDVAYGPFSAAYPGNSYGAVTEITTRMPAGFEAGIKASASQQRFSQYGTNDTYPAAQVGMDIGNRQGDLSWWLSANHLSSFSQPVTYLTLNNAGTPAGAALPVIAGGFADRNRTGGPIQVIGAGSLTQTVQDSARLKLAYAFNPGTEFGYTLGYWQNQASSRSESYLSGNGSAYYSGTSGSVNIGGNAYGAAAIAGLFSAASAEQEHWMQAFSLKRKQSETLRWEAVLTDFRYGKDISRLSTGPYATATGGGTGRVTDAAGTGWTTLDVKGDWRAGAGPRQHQLAFGVHWDQYRLASPTYTVGDWRNEDRGNLFSDSRGKTRTTALWLQDSWRLQPALAATIGARYERWQAYDGYNFAVNGSGTAFPVVQPQVDASGLSPKLSLAWQAASDWSLTGSLGKALRFPTVGELYQNVQTGSTFTQANPFLKPERVLAAELALAHENAAGRWRLSLFEEHVEDALVAQTASLAGVAAPVSFVQNIGRTRQRGVELSGGRRDVLIKGLELQGSLTYVDARITDNPGYVPATPGATSVGKRTPYVPAWRASLVATWRPDERLAYTLAGRYSSRLYATVDNTDVNPATYQGFEGFVVFDARLRYRIDRHWSAAVGVDNLNDRRYFLFHPFPQRTVTAELAYRF